MSLKCGIVGLPNVGKSTLFNALVRTKQAQAENYPFCTIESNVGRVLVFDDRLSSLVKLTKSQKMIFSSLELVDIAGLVKGASHGEGLGNQFLSYIRSVDAILHVVRCFEDHNIIHVNGTIDPVQDIEIVQTELLLSDISTLNHCIQSKKNKKFSSSNVEELTMMQKMLTWLSFGKPARLYKDLDLEFFKKIGLLTIKPMCYVCNVSEDDVQKGNIYTYKVKTIAHQEGAQVVSISAVNEIELSVFTFQELKQLLDDKGLKSTGLSKIAQACYSLLNLITFFTVGPQEGRAWSILRGTTALNASGVIHSDFMKGFIRAEIISYKDFIQCGGVLEAKKAGKFRMEGRDYIMVDGDIVYFHFN